MIPAQLKEITMNKETRKLIKVKIQMKNKTKKNIKFI